VDVKAYKPDSVLRRSHSPRLDDHFSGIRVASNLERPTRRPRPGQSVYRTHGESCICLPIWPCTGRRLPCRGCCHHRGGLLPRRFTLTWASATRWNLIASAIGGLISVVLVSDRSAWELPSALPMESGLSSRCRSTERSPSLHLHAEV